MCKIYVTPSVNFRSVYYKNLFRFNGKVAVSHVNLLKMTPP